ncbi:MAG: hypothetical protein ACLVJH_03820 [Faecalibacterium prausnitzii]
MNIHVGDDCIAMKASKVFLGHEAEDAAASTPSSATACWTRATAASSSAAR